MLYETIFLISLFITLIIEVPVLLLITKFFYKDKKNSLSKIAVVGIIASSLTLPYLWFILSPYVASNHFVVIGEFLVFLIEALIYNQLLELKFNRALFASFICNLVSFLFGLIILTNQII